MARFDEKSGNLYVTELGRVASHFYIKHSSIVTYNELLKPHMSETDVSWLTELDLGMPCTCYTAQILYIYHSSHVTWLERCCVSTGYTLISVHNYQMLLLYTG